MLDDPHIGSKLWKAPDREIGKPGENRGRIGCTSAAHKRDRGLRRFSRSFLGERLLRAEVIGEGALRNPSSCADIAYTRSLVSQSKHHLEAGIKNRFSM
jgi:hypothetical protein